MWGGRAHLAALAVVVLVLAITGCERQKKQVEQAPEQGAQVNWKMASSFSATLPIIGTSGPYFSEKVERLTRGRMNIKFFDPGKLVPALEVFDAVSKGSVDAGWSTAGYWIGKIPAAAFFTAVPFGPDTSEYLSWIYHGGGLELWRELYAPHNLYPIPCQAIPPEASGWFRAPISRLDQFKGMKIRFFGLGGQAMQKVGASVQLLAGGDIYPALERGVLDATEFSMPSLDEQLGFSKIAKHYYFPGWHQQSSVAEFIVNVDRWKSLDPADQELLETICRDVILRDITLGEFQQTAALKRIKQDGVSVHFWSQEILTGFKRAWDEVIAENTAKDPDFKRVYESYKAFRDEYAEWAKISRVPLDIQ
jgi:TRAP-type mannitol/chloroaromatic compound transport system substrate-binding protein